jgi:hypothetical protein
MKLTTLAAAVAALLAASAAHAQTVAGPRAQITFDQPQAASCENPTVMNAWNFTYGSCYRPAGVNLGDPFIQQVKVTLAAATTISTLVPRGQVTAETTAARCLTGTSTVAGSAACLRISDVPVPSGTGTMRLNFVDGEGREGAASAAVPFTASSPAVPAAAGLRVVTTP